MKIKKMKKLAIFTLVTALILGVAYSQQLRTVKVKVVEEDGTPIENAEVGVYYLAYNTDNDVEVSGKTDETGVFSASKPVILRMEVSVHKKGYYPTHSGRLSRKKDHEVTYILRKKKKPIALYAKRFQVIPPIQTQKIGYDFKIGDWVAPHGKGKNVDVIFEMSRVRKDVWNVNYKLKVEFPNPHDGIQQFQRKELSDFESPYKAPKQGYAKSWLQKAKREGKDKPIVSNTDPFRGHWMRVRTQTDKDGRIIKANYIKIYGDFPDIRYYFNPKPNDRNLEFDTTKNLFKNLKHDELVWKP